MTRDVFLLDADATNPLQFIHALAFQGGYRVTALSRKSDSILRYSRHCHFILFPEWDSLLMPRADRPILLPMTLSAQLWMIQHKAELALHWALPPLPDLEAYQLSRDKKLLTNFLQKNGFPTPRSGPLSNPSPPFPLFVKPSYTVGGKGMKKFHEISSLQSYLANLANHDSYFLQEHIEGQDISYGLLCKDGELLLATPYTWITRSHEYGHFGSIEILADHPSLPTVRAFVKALRWSGLLNIDLLYTPTGEVHIIDFNPRPWANLRSLLVANVNFAHQLCNLADGRPLSPTTPRAARFFNLSGSLALLAKAPHRFYWKNSLFRFIADDPLPFIANIAQRLREEKLSFLSSFSRACRKARNQIHDH